MDTLIALLTDFGFHRTVDRIEPDTTIVVHGVAGCGKTTLLEKALEDIENLVVYTTQTPQGPTLSGRRIKKLGEEVPSFPPNAIPVLDEYLGSDLDLSSFKVLLADPFQYAKESRVAHFVKEETYRFGKQSCDFIKEHLGYPIKSQRFDTLTFEDIWTVENQGQAICFEEELHKLLDNQRLTHIHAKDARGLTFKRVSLYVTDLKISSDLRHLAYISLTRHRTHLHIVTPLNRRFPRVTAPDQGTSEPNAPSAS